MQRICVVGAQNTGKTTFIKDIISEFPKYTTPTFTYRDVIKADGGQLLEQINENTNIHAQTILFNAVCREFDSATSEYVIFDRSPMDAVAYTYWPIVYKADKTDITVEAYEKMRSTAEEYMSRYDLIIYIPVVPEIKIENDLLRSTSPEYRLQMDEIFKDLFLLPLDSPAFRKYGYKVIMISGTREERDRKFKFICEGYPD